VKVQHSQHGELTLQNPFEKKKYHTYKDKAGVVYEARPYGEGYRYYRVE
jgi:hypothetical protein